MGVTATDLAQIPMSADLGSTLTRGSEFAEATGAGEVTLEHLLHALCDDPDAIAVLDASQINIEGLRADVTARAYQGGVQSQSPSSGGLAVSHDVRRILEAAAAAARGSRRRDINGAIVLAAIVGDARSMAAEILQAHGLNFDNAIRALQAALAPVRDVPAQVPVADDVLARARERVQSRSAPSLRDMMKDTATGGAAAAGCCARDCRKSGKGASSTGRGGAASRGASCFRAAKRGGGSRSSGRRSAPAVACLYSSDDNKR